MLSSGATVSGVATAMQSGGNSYSNERPPSGIDVEYAIDPASGGFFNTDYKKYIELYQLV